MGGKLASILKRASLVFLGICQWFWTHVSKGILLPQHSPLTSFAFLDSQTHSTSPCQQAVLPQYGYILQTQKRYQDSPPQLPSIYSGIGLGVYQGEIVVFRQMAVGERHWVMSKLRFEDLSQLPDSMLSDVYLSSCFLRLSRTQSDLVRKGLQTKDAMRLMKSLCPLADCLDKLLLGEYDDGNLAPVPKKDKGKQCHLRCLIH